MCTGRGKGGYLIFKGFVDNGRGKELTGLLSWAKCSTFPSIAPGCFSK